MEEMWMWKIERFIKEQPNSEAKEKGVSPCELCRLKDSNCGAVNCYSWYVWFSEKWQNIKEAARRKGYNV